MTLATLQTVPTTPQSGSARGGIVARSIALVRLVTRARYQRFILRGTARDRLFAITMLRLLFAYRTGAMRCAALTATEPAE